MSGTLRHCLIDKCPQCGAGTRCFAMNGTHVNGQQFETRSYECGCIMEHVPNFNRTQVKKACPYSPEFKTEQEMGERDRNRLRAVLKELESHAYRKHVSDLLGGFYG